MTLLTSTDKFIEKERLFGLLDSVLVGVSGGQDSMCLLYVLHQLKYKVRVAHVNYRLRGIESDKDERLVVDYCEKHQIDCHVYIVTEEDASMLQARNFQESARNLRYQYFEKLRLEFCCDKIAIAHHQNDLAETFIMNAIRGSGSSGLRSIQPINGRIVRPFLTSSRKEVSNFVTMHKIPYRIDESNNSNKYSRNFIRNEIIPDLESRWPSAVTGIEKSARLQSDENQLLRYLIDQERPKWIHVSSTVTQIGPLSELVLIPGHKSILWHCLKEYGIGYGSIENIIDSHSTTGNDFSTITYSIIVDRDFIKIELVKGTTPIHLTIDKPGIYQTILGQLQMQAYIGDEKPHVDQEVVDGAKVIFPLILRNWKKGDRWQALGMKGKHKKVSDFLIDQKIDRLSKNKVLLVEDANEDIIWLVGHRISELIKTSGNTNYKLHLKWRGE